jgi:hypothetical protein
MNKPNTPRRIQADRPVAPKKAGIKILAFRIRFVLLPIKRESTIKNFHSRPIKRGPSEDITTFMP